MPNIFAASELMDQSVFNALNPKADIVSYANLINAAVSAQTGEADKKALRPELFYTKQLLETIRLGADQYPYFRVAETSPIPDKSQKLQLRRWAPLEAHTVPLVEGIPPKSDKGSVETYEIGTNAYGRFMEFTDRVDLDVVDPVITTYTKEYSIVAVETLDLLARDALLMVAQKNWANQALDYDEMTLDLDAEGRAIYGPSIEDLRLIILSMKKALVKPRINGRFQVICSPEFVYDLINDPYVEKYMQYNNSTKTMYESGSLVPMFDMEFYESMATPNTNEYTKDNKRAFRFYCVTGTDAEGNPTYAYRTIDEVGNIYEGDTVVGTVEGFYSKVDGYVKDVRTGMDASYIPQHDSFNIAAFLATAVGGNDSAKGQAATYGELGNWQEMKFHHCLVLGKDALIRTGMSGQDNAKMYVKAKGSAGVLDPIDQRQSIGFKINSVGFGSARPEAVHDYICIPSTLNLQ
jgi:N4-gp56 family major capsid protein